MNLEEKVKVLKGSIGLSEAGQLEIEELARKAEVRHYQKGEYIFQEDDPPDYFQVVARGRVKESKLSSSGKSFTAIIADRGDTLNAVVLFSGKPRFLTAQAMDDVTLVCLKRRDFVDFVRDHPAVALKIIGILGDLVQTSYERILDLVGERVEQRVINVLFMLHSKFGPDLDFTNRELGELSGTTTETTIRVMGELKARGILASSRGRIRIIDQEALARLGRGPFWA